MRIATMVCSLWLAVTTGCLYAQDLPPGTEIYVLGISKSSGQLTAKDLHNATRRKGYDNQPSFTPDSRAFLFTSIREDGQADVYRYDISSDEESRLTRTGESEYSPTVMPGAQRFSTVRVEMDGTQRLWSFALDGTAPELLLPDLQPVGYHAWGDKNQLALFILGEPHSLYFADLSPGNAGPVASDIGRSLHKIPGKTAFSFMQQNGENNWTIKEIDMLSRAQKKLIQPVNGNQDYTWMPDGTLLMADQTTLYRCDPAKKPEWQAVLKIDNPQIASITRLAVSPDNRWLAIVVPETEE